MPVTALRYHNVYGPRMPRDTPYAGVASIFRSALEAGEPPQVFEDGGQRRDFVHVRDVARANLRALLAPEPVPGAFNVASGTPRTVLEMAEALADAFDRAPRPVVTGEWRGGDVRHIVASADRAAESLGFRAARGLRGRHARVRARPAPRPVTAAARGLAVALALVAAAMAVPAVTGWVVHIRSFPPLHADWAPRIGAGTVPALVLALLAARYAVDLAERLPWRALPAAVFAAGLAWMLSLAFVDGPDGIGHVLETPYEYLRTARNVTDVHQLLQEYVSRIPYSSAPKPNWPVHVAGHPPGALLFFVGLDRAGLGGGFAAGMVVTVIAATTAVAVLLTVRTLGDEASARRAAPFLVFAPAAVWQAVSADAMFAAVAAWALAALALASTRRRAGWAVAAGLRSAAA